MSDMVTYELTQENGWLRARATRDDGVVAEVRLCRGNFDDEYVIDYAAASAPRTVDVDLPEFVDGVFPGNIGTLMTTWSTIGLPLYVTV